MKTKLCIALALVGTALGAIKDAHAPPCCREGLPPLKATAKSLYGLDVKWTSDLGREVKLDVVRGRPVVLLMYFTNCEHSCPLMVGDLKAIEAGLSARARAKTDFVLVSIDPDRDSVAALKTFREQRKLGPEHWMLLRGETPDVCKLAEAIGFQYVPGSKTQFAHSLLVTVLNARGEIVFQQAGVSGDRREAIRAIEKLLPRR